MSHSRLTVSTTLRTDVATAWECWTSPSHIMNWNFASDDWHCPKATNDLRAGGKFISTMAAKDNSMSFDFEGTYDEVVPLSRISYTMPDGRKVDIHFSGTDGNVTVTETFDPEQVNSLELQQAGWQAILDNYRKYVENKAAK